MSEIEIVVGFLFLLVAVLYSSVGHAGASGYIASMALLGFAPESLRPSALALNLLVGGIGLFRFARAGHVNWRHILPFVAASMPAAYFAAQWKIPAQSYSLLLGLVLLVAAAGVLWQSRNADAQDQQANDRHVPWLLGLLIGGSIGVLSGLTGTGGAIFLTPILLFAGWMPTRQASGTSVAFVWLNSLMGLTGLLKSGAVLPSALPYWLVAVAIGALIGTQLGIKTLPAKPLRWLLAAVLLIASGKLLFA